MSDFPPASDRRRFLALSLAATATLGAPTAQATPAFSGWFRAEMLERMTRLRRRNRARRLRVQVANEHARGRLAEQPRNGDEETLAHALGSFTKALPHDALGRVEPDAWQRLLRALESGEDADFDAIPAGGPTKLANPQAAFAYSLAGADSHALAMPAPPAYASAEAAAEIVEVYAHALLRDVPFDAYASSPEVPPVLAALHQLSAFEGPTDNGAITPATLFRGTTPGDLDGPYLSQFLLLDIPQGAALVPQRYHVPGVNDDHMTSEADWLHILRGGSPTTSLTIDPEPRYLATGRDLGEYVHRDFPSQSFLNAALILLGLGAPPNPANPYLDKTNREGFTTFGVGEIIPRVAEVAQLALKAAWFQKWLVHRRVRPEVFGGRIHQHLAGTLDSPIHPEALASPLLDEVFSRHGTRLLPMAYPEGSPTHPAYPAGHATVSGACVTVLKAFFDGSWILPSPVEVDPDSAATALRPLAANLSVEGELNKLANNIAIGRNIAGVHWRSDGHQGLLLGEQVALAALRDWNRLRTEPHQPIRFRGFRGDPITL